MKKKNNKFDQNMLKKIFLFNFFALTIIYLWYINITT